MVVCSSVTCTATWCPSQRVLLLPGAARPNTFARGLTRALTATFAPHFSYARAIAGAPARKPAKHGFAVGVQLDTELAAWVATEQHKPLANRAVPSARLRAVLALFTRRGWQPLAAQLPLGCHALRLGTMADVLVRDAAGQYVLLELKSGFDDYFDVANQGTLAYPFQHVPASFRNKHLLQLLCTAWLFSHCVHPFDFQHTGRVLQSAHIVRCYETTAGELCTTVVDLPLYLYGDATLLRECLRSLQRTRHTTTAQH
jgi:hypothetical protein